MRAGLDWLKVSVDLADHKKALHLAAILGEPLAFAYLIRLWSWCGKGNAMDGNVRGPSADCPWTVLVESACGWQKDRGQLANALVSAGWLDLVDGGEGGVSVHDWDEHAGAFLEKAEKERERARKRRAQQRPRTVRGLSADCPRTVHAERERKRKSERKRETETETEKHSSADADATAAGDLFAVEAANVGPTPDDLQAMWNATAPAKCPRWKETPPAREKKARSRIADAAKFPGGPLAWWESVIAAVKSSSFLRGDKTDFRASPDWLLNPTNLAKVMEGNYADGPGIAPRTGFNSPEMRDRLSVGRSEAPVLDAPRDPWAGFDANDPVGREVLKEFAAKGDKAAAAKLAATGVTA
jgi:hypothetical protein